PFSLPSALENPLKKAAALGARLGGGFRLHGNDLGQSGVGFAFLEDGLNRSAGGIFLGFVVGGLLFEHVGAGTHRVVVFFVEVFLKESPDNGGGLFAAADDLARVALVNNGKGVD